MSPGRGAILIGSALLVGIVLAYRQQWDTEGDPLVSWDYPPRFPPPASFRRWFVRIAPILVLIGVGAFLMAAVAMR
jgi:hypothetical protein